MIAGLGKPVGEGNLGYLFQTEKKDTKSTKMKNELLSSYNSTKNQ